MFPGLILYLALFVVVGIDLSWLILGDISIKTEAILPACISIATIGGLCLGSRYLNTWLARILPEQSRAASKALCDQTTLVFDGIFFISVSWIFLPLYNLLTLSTHFPYADNLLASADHFLHLDWPSYLLFVAERPWLMWFYNLVYFLLPLLSVLTFLILMIVNRPRQAQFYIAAYFINAMICMTIAMLLPAQEPIMHYFNGHIPIAGYKGLVPALEHLPYMEFLRGSQPVALDLTGLPGLATFPSFHTAAAIVLTWSLRQTRFFWPSLLYIIVMIASTPLIGGHYFVDLIGGGIIAVTVLLCLQRLPQFHGLFNRTA